MFNHKELEASSEKGGFVSGEDNLIGVRNVVTTLERGLLACH